MTSCRIAHPDLVRFIRDVLLAVGAPPNVAEVETEIRAPARNAFAGRARHHYI